MIKKKSVVITLKNIKNIIVSLLILLVLSCILFVSCTSEQVQGGVPVEITVSGVNLSRNVVIYARKQGAKENVEIEASRKDSYVSTLSLDDGDYTIIKIKSDSRDYELTAITSEFSIKEQEENKIEIQLEEKNVGGTLIGFLKKNAFTLLVLISLSIALMVIKQRKNSFTTNSKSKIE